MKITSKQADATLAKLTSAMARNTSLATTAESAVSASASPVATYTATTVRTPSRPVSSKPVSRTSGIRLKPVDLDKIHQVIQAGLELRENLAASDVIRLALAAYDPKRLSPTDIAALKARDGRSQKARGVSH